MAPLALVAEELLILVMPLLTVNANQQVVAEQLITAPIIAEPGSGKHQITQTDVGQTLMVVTFMEQVAK